MSEKKLKKISIIAHRGASGNAPENTLAAFKLALENHVDFIEIDVHLSKDSVPVVIHDNTLNRTTNGKGLVFEHELKQLKKLDAGSWFSKTHQGEKIPTLEEVINLTKGKCKLLIEIKHGSNRYPNIEELTLQIIHKLQVQNQCIIQSFDEDVIANLKKLKCSVEVHKLIEGDFPVKLYNIYSSINHKTKKGKASIGAINPNQSSVNQKFIKNIHKQKKKTFIWTVNDQKDMMRMIKMGVDGIITNYPEKLKKLIIQ
jgi:glycerophosphoryl diester phosphodiesterase